MTIAIYELSPIGVGGAYEADGVVHYYCSVDHAEQHAVTQGFHTSATYSRPQETDAAIEGTQCEWCGQTCTETKEGTA